MFIFERVLDIDKDENFSLQLSNQLGYVNSESILTVSYSAAKGIIAAGTDKGNVAMWKFMSNVSKFGEPEASWQLLHAKSLQLAPIQQLKVRQNMFLMILNIKINLSKIFFHVFFSLEQI